MSGIPKIDFDDILKNIYIIVILQVFFKSDYNIQNLGNNDNCLDSNSIDGLPSNNWSESNSVYNIFGNNIIDNQNTNFETLFNSFNKKLNNNMEISDSIIDKKESLELNNNEEEIKK